MPKAEIILDPIVEKSLRTVHADLADRGKLPSEERLKSCYDLFRARFGPDKLRGLDGEDLLNTIHGRDVEKDSLVYWLEFKNDEEFPTRQFGSIKGGSSLKFGIAKKIDTGEWVTGHAKNPTMLTIPEAVEMARKHRKQLLAAAAALQELPPLASDAEYLVLQQKMNQVAPDVCDVAWGHKYLHLLFSDRLDDYHVDDYQRHHLIKLLLPPASPSGLFACAGQFVRLAHQLGWPMNHLTAVLNARDGNPVKYWRIGTKLDKGNNAEDIWPDMQTGGYAAIGWAELGDLSGLLNDDDARKKINVLFGQEYEYAANVASRKAGEVRNFVKAVSERDVILAADGTKIRGVGLVKGPYHFDSSKPEGAPHRHPVEWHDCSSWELPVSEGLQTTVKELKDDVRTLIEAEKYLLGPALQTTSMNTLAAPFNQIFTSYQEADWAFDFFKETLARLSVTSPDDLRVALTLPKSDKILRLNFCQWVITSFFGANQGADRAEVALLSEFSGSADLKKRGAFTTKPHEPGMEIYGLPVEKLRTMDPDLRSAFDKSLAHVASRFKDQPKSGFLQHHQKQLMEMVFDKIKRAQYLTGGLPGEVATSAGSFGNCASNTILYGPPGTGKTYKTIERAVQIIEPDFMGDHAAYKSRFDALRAKGQIEFITFHQSYSYEDFVEGLRPVIEGPESSEAAYEYSSGVFKRFALQALFDCLKPTAGIVSFDAVWKKLVEQSELEPDRLYPGLSEKTSYRISLSTKGNLEGINTISNKTFLCSRSILEKVFVARPENETVTSSEVMEVVARGCHSHFVAAMFNELKRIEKSEFAGRQPSAGAALFAEQKAGIAQAFLEKNNTGTDAFKPVSEWPNYVLVIDEINRGNISKILGELITLIEPDKRLGAENSLVVTLPYTKHCFAVPGNLHLLGTMNTADKSIALVDVALRRRFQFEELRPNFDHCPQLTQSMRDVLNTLNRRICLRKDRDHQVGHSYFIQVKDEAGFNRVFARHVIPLLQEYFYNDWDGLRFVLGVKNQPDKLIIPLKDGDSGDSRSSWQWSFEAGTNEITDVNFLQLLGGDNQVA